MEESKNVDQNYSAAYCCAIPRLIDANVTNTVSIDCRSVYMRTITENVSNVFKIGEVPNINFAPEKWTVRIGPEEVNLHGNFLAIGTTREIGNRNNINFYQFQHPENAAPDVSRVHCVLYFYEDFVAVVDLWSSLGTDVVIHANTITSKQNNRKIIKITDSGHIVFRKCRTARNILVKRKKEIIDVANLEVKECVICTDNETTHIVVPCGHKCLCEDCSKSFPMQMMKCPMCRVDIGSVIRVFET